MSNHCTIEKHLETFGFILMLSYKISSSVCVCGGGGTSSKYIVQMQPRWYKT